MEPVEICCALAAVATYSVSVSALKKRLLRYSNKPENSEGKYHNGKNNS